MPAKAQDDIFTTVCKSQEIFVGSIFACILGALTLLLGGPLIRFTDRAFAWGFQLPTTYGNPAKNNYILESTGNGAVIFDFDGDGRNDVLITNGTTLEAKPVEGAGLLLYHNEGPGQFREMGSSVGLKVTGWAQAACAADFDNDGKTDFAVTYYGFNRVFHNVGGRFEDVTKAAGLPVSGTRWGSGCAWIDYDRDGFVDLFLANYVNLDLRSAPKPGEGTDCIWKGMPVFCGPLGLPKATNVLYHNNGDGTFEDVSAKAGILKAGGRYGLGVAIADFNNDGWPDIYVACDQTPSELFENKRDGTFLERGVEAGVAYNSDGRLQSGMGVGIADINGDGFLDIAKTNFSGDLPSLFMNEDGRFFREAAREAGLGAHQLLGWGAAFLDADEDGFPDLIMANGHVYPEIDQSKLGERYRQLTLLYRNLGDGKFTDITALAGAPFQVARPARGLAEGDLDGDGRPEIVIVNMNEPPTVLKNESVRGNWVRVALEGSKSNRSAIGARVTVEAGGRRLMADVSSGGSYYSQNELALYFGLGKAVRIEKITVRWPNGNIQVFRDVPADRTVMYRE
jgi:enediyne biosynthesis protein E4